jgi:hypothetical protein
MSAGQPVTGAAVKPARFGAWESHTNGNTPAQKVQRFFSPTQTPPFEKFQDSARLPPLPRGFFFKNHSISVGLPTHLSQKAPFSSASASDGNVEVSVAMRGVESSKPSMFIVSCEVFALGVDGGGEKLAADSDIRGFCHTNLFQGLRYAKFH